MIPLIRPNVLAFMILLGLVFSAAAAPPPANPPLNLPPSPSAARPDIQQWIEDLGHDQYHRRQAAKAKLIRLANHGKANDLAGGLKHASLEVRSSVSEILLMVRQEEFVRNLERLTDPVYPIEKLSSDGWKEFSKVAGSDEHARLAFAAICRRHPSAFASMRTVNAKQLKFINPFQLSVGDHVGWMILLLPAGVESETDGSDLVNELDSTETTQISRIAMALSQTSMGLNPSVVQGRPDWLEPVLSRIVADWINRHHSIIDEATTMRVAVRYHCDQVAIKIARQTLNNPSSAASAKVTAMLTLSKSKNQDLLQDKQNVLREFTTDERTVRVWQALTDRRIRIQTQVRDVAVALMLDQAGQDPRQFGFNYLEADPLLRFRDYSLGFENDQIRHAAYAEALDFLATGN